MLHPSAALRAADIAAQCLELIMKVNQNSGKNIDRNPEQVALIGDIILSAIAATQSQQLKEGKHLEASTD